MLKQQTPILTQFKVLTARTFSQILMTHMNIRWIWILILITCKIYQPLQLFKIQPRTTSRCWT